VVGQAIRQAIRLPSLSSRGAALCEFRPAAGRRIACPSVPSMGRIYRDERSSTELMTTTVAKRKV